MKKLMACLMALILISCAALADGTDALTLGILNPRITANGNTLLDLSRLDVETSLIYDGEDAIGVILDVNVGENFEVKVLSAQARWDGGRLQFSIDGVDRLYNVDTPKALAASGTGLSRVFFPTDSPIPNIDLTRLTAEQRMALLEAVLEPYVKDKKIIGEDRILSFDISRDESTIIINGIVGFLDEIFPSLGQNSILSLFGQEDGLGINLKGKLTIGPDGLKLESDGALITLKNGAVIPLVQDLTDSYDGFTLSIGLGENEVGKLVMQGRRNQANGDLDVSLEQTYDGASVAVGRFTRTAGDHGTKYALDYAHANGQKLYAEFTDDLADDSPSFDFSATAALDPADGERTVTAYYDGQHIETEGRMAQGGLFGMEYSDGQSKYGFESTVVLMHSGNAVRYAQWAKQLAGASALDLTGGSQEDLYQFEADLSVIAGGVLSKLQENVPGVSELLGALQNLQ